VPESFDDLERRLVEWAEEREDVRTMVVVGSRARPEEADEWSDLDVGFTTTAPGRYEGTAWLSEIGEVWVAHVDPSGATRNVVFVGGFDAGITPLPHRLVRALPAVLRLWEGPAGQVLPAPLRGPVDRRLEAYTYYGRGARVVVDKDGVGAKLLAAVPSGAAGAGGPPTSDEFEAAVARFWFLAVWNAKHLRRGELWRAKALGCDGEMKRLLVQMTGWHSGVEVSEDGRGLEEQVDPAVVAELASVFARYVEDDLWRASSATMDLFRRLATETAARVGFPYDTEADRRVTGWVEACEAGRR
jgi:aminoglycoside 6-adenylyltransferase